MTIAHLKNWIKEKVIEAVVFFLGVWCIICFATFFVFSIEHPVFFGVSVAHFIATVFCSFLLFRYLGISVDFPGANIGGFVWLPSLLLFHTSMCVILGLNKLGVTQVVLGWNVWIQLASGSLIVAVTVGTIFAWLDQRHT